MKYISYILNNLHIELLFYNIVEIKSIISLDPTYILTFLLCYEAADVWAKWAKWYNIQGNRNMLMKEEYDE